MQQEPVEVRGVRGCGGLGRGVAGDAAAAATATATEAFVHGGEGDVLPGRGLLQGV
jgi:hypothetical protein